MKWAIVALNQQSISQAMKLKSARQQCSQDDTDSRSSQVDIYTIDKYMGKGLIRLDGGLKAYNESLFRDYKVIIYVMAMGIIVRDIAPYLKHKSVDPAVLCLSVDGKYIIPVISGHLGGANQVALTISQITEAVPVITTASDVLGKAAVDMIAKDNNLVIGSFKEAKILTAMMIDDKNIQVVSEPVVDIEGEWEQPISGMIEGMRVEPSFSEACDGAIVIGYNNKAAFDRPYASLFSKRLVLGIGAKRNTPFTKIKEFLKELLEANHMDHRSICMVASIDLKADEEGIIQLAEWLAVPFETYGADELLAVVDRFEQSTFVQSITGVGAVSMPSGYLASDRGRCLVSKVAKDGMTLSIFEMAVK